MAIWPANMIRAAQKVHFNLMARKEKSAISSAPEYLDAPTGACHQPDQREHLQT